MLGQLGVESLATTRFDQAGNDKPIGGQRLLRSTPTICSLNGFETGDGEVAAWWSATINGGEFGTVSRSNSMPNSDEFVTCKPNFGNSGAATPYGIEPAGDRRRIELRSVLLGEGSTFTGFDMTYQIDEFGAVQGNEFHCCYHNTSYQLLPIWKFQEREFEHPSPTVTIDVSSVASSSSARRLQWRWDCGRDRFSLQSSRLSGNDPGVGSLSAWQQLCRHECCCHCP